MAIKIKFDLVGNPEPPTIILANRNGNMLGQLKIDTDSIELVDKFNDASEISFIINKYIDEELTPLWEKVLDFKLIYCKEWDAWFEVRVELDEETETVKTVFGTQLGYAELSQIMLYNIEINTDDDIARDDYKISILYDQDHPDASILNRILKDKAPHYSIEYVSPTIAKIQRSFSFDGISILDAFQKISEEIGCLFQYYVAKDENGILQRKIAVYDLQQYCNDCGHRSEYTDKCPKCGSTNVTNGYGNDTLIFVTSDELASEGISLVTDTDSVKNCFKLEAGDDLLTATIRNCNPNGTDYIWYFSDSIKEDMSDELVSKLDSYDKLYNQYYNEYVSDIDTNSLNNYNSLIGKYSGSGIIVTNLVIDTKKTGGNYSCTYGKELVYAGDTVDVKERFTASSVVSLNTMTSALKGNYLVLSSGIYYIPTDAEFRSSSSTTNYVTTDTLSVNKAQKVENPCIIEGLEGIETPITGYHALMNAYYNTVDMALRLESSLMPSVELSDTTANEQVKLITSSSLSPVAVSDITIASLATVNSAVLAMAKIIVNSTYKVEIDTSEMIDDESSRVWRGNFIVTNYSDEEDTAVSNTISVNINDDLETFVKQKIEKALSKEDTDDLSITGLFEYEYDKFCGALKEYALNPLMSIHDACQACIDILIERGIGNDKQYTSWDDEDEPELSLYESLYLPYYDKLMAVESEIKIREDEINVIYELQEDIDKCRIEIQDALNFEDYLGNELWLEFCTYRREDEYSNENYISDGLNSAELFEKALEFIEVAKNEIYKSAELQHSISASLNNLLAIEKFKPLVDSFENGNWIRVQIDNNIYKLRLIEYGINFGDFDNIPVEFSDVTKVKNGVTDVESILSQASSMATSYDSIKRQSEQGNKANTTINNWLESGLNSALVRIQNNDSEEITLDKNGLLGRSYDDITETYSPEQIRLTHNIIAYTDDNWKSARMAIGKHDYIIYDKDSGAFKNETGYGINADFVTAGVVSGSQIIGGDIYSDNYSVANETGSYLNLRDGTFSFGGGSLRFEGGSLLIDSPNIPTTSQITEINENYIKTATVYAENLQVGSANIVGQLTAEQINTVGLIAENISGATINGKSITGGSIDGAIITGGSININDKFIVNSNGDVTIPSGTITLGDISESTNLATKDYLAQQGFQNETGVTTIIGGVVTADYVNLLSVKAGSVDAENITGTTISGKTLSGGSIVGSSINIGSGTFTVDSNGNMIANSGTFKGALDGVSGSFTALTAGQSEFTDNYIKIDAGNNKGYILIGDPTAMGYEEISILPNKHFTGNIGNNNMAFDVIIGQQVYNISERGLKENIQVYNIEQAYDELKMMPIYTYNYIDDSHIVKKLKLGTIIDYIPSEAMANTLYGNRAFDIGNLLYWDIAATQKIQIKLEEIIERYDDIIERLNVLENNFV